MDALTEFLRTAPVSGGLFARAEFTAPWGVSVERLDRAVFHVVVQGQAWLTLDDEVPVALSPGDLVVLPHGDPHVVRDTPRSPATRFLRDRRIAAALDAIHREPARAWTLGDMARRAAMSRSAFARRFKDLVGESPGQYLARWRVHCAAHLLRTESFTVAQIAGRVGYESEATFSRAFKRYAGTSPATYGRQLRSARAAVAQ